MIPFDFKKFSLMSLIERRGWIVAGAFALAAAILSWVMLGQEKARLANQAKQNLAAFQENTVDIVLAKADIPSGKLITEIMLYTQRVDKNSLPAEAATSVARVVDRISTVPIKEKYMIPVDKLVWPTTRETTLASKTPIGKRAMTISVDNISSLLGMIKPGDYVDVIGVIPLPVEVDGKQAAEPATVPLFQNVLVLSVGTELGPDGEKESSSRRKASEAAPREVSPLITLSLTPEEANILAFVKEQGKIQLILRSPGDAQTRPVQPTSWATVLKHLFPQIELEAMEKGPKKEEPEKEIPQVEIIRGFKKEVVPLRQNK
ncbi:MAG: Flp pilus assembly protein CpaB [Candidatus Omnitrophota bacterium]